MKKIKLSHINAALLVMLLVAAAFILRPIFFAQTPLPSPRPAEPDRRIRSTPVDTAPALQLHDLDRLNGGNGSLNVPDDNAKIKPADIREAKEWRDADPNVKKEMIDELDANIANSKKALEINPNDTMAKRILLASERRKRIETENFEGKYLGKDVKIEDIDTATAR